MLQIVIWMLCVYMVFKGQEMVITARSSAPDVRDEAVKAAQVWALLAYAAALVFFVLSLLQGASGPSMPPRF